MESPYRVPTGTAIGHVHLKVADIDRALAFYSSVLGFESIYLADPDGNGIELTCDRPESEWLRDANGDIAMAMAEPLDALLREASR